MDVDLHSFSDLDISPPNSDVEAIVSQSFDENQSLDNRSFDNASETSRGLFVDKLDRKTALEEAT